MSAREIGETVLAVENVSLSFGGVQALSEVSFDVREHEVRAIIGPNGAGKSSMLNVINGVYQPQSGTVTFRGETHAHMESHHAAERGIARTFQSLALFRGMSALDNIMTGRNLKMKSNILAQALRIGPAAKEEMAHREFVEHIIDFLEIQAIRKTPVGQLPYGLQKRRSRAHWRWNRRCCCWMNRCRHERRGAPGHAVYSRRNDGSAPSY
jgi:branched-chain amino acid transport system ATP-binding protein